MSAGHGGSSRRNWRLMYLSVEEADERGRLI